MEIHSEKIKEHGFTITTTCYTNEEVKIIFLDGTIKQQGFCINGGPVKLGDLSVQPMTDKDMYFKVTEITEKDDLVFLTKVEITEEEYNNGGRDFRDKLVNALNRIGDQLERANDLKEKELEQNKKEEE